MIYITQREFDQKLGPNEISGQYETSSANFQIKDEYGENHHIHVLQKAYQGKITTTEMILPDLKFLDTSEFNYQKEYDKYPTEISIESGKIRSISGIERAFRVPRNQIDLRQTGDKITEELYKPIILLMNLTLPSLIQKAEKEAGEPVVIVWPKIESAFLHIPLLQNSMSIHLKKLL